MNDLYSALSRLVKALDPANGEVPPESECKAAFLQAKEVLEHHSNNGWQPIETAPKDKRILLSDGNSVGSGSYMHWIPWDGFYFDGASLPSYADHWMPLPTSPEVKK